MTWEETILHIRTLPEFSDLVEKAYFDENLSLNVERFRTSDEFVETIRLIKMYAPESKNILDIGCGNGISTISFALLGYNVTAVEPDKSDTVGSGAIRKLVDKYNLTNIKILESYVEDLDLPKGSFDLVYARQSMHHAYNLTTFINKLSDFLHKDGILFTTRDHVVFDTKDKEAFLKSHPLQKYYGGENAFHYEEYAACMTNSGLKIEKMYRFFDNIINYFPLSSEYVKRMPIEYENIILNSFEKKYKLLSKLQIIRWLFKKKIGFKSTDCYNELKYPGRIYSFIARKI